MAKHRPEPELLPLAHACRCIGVTPPTYIRLAGRGEVPRVVLVGKKRAVGRRALQAWIAEKTGAPVAA
jgi:hypothetical protein